MGKLKYNIAIVGATGLVGSTILKLLDEYNIPVNKLYLFASKKSLGKKIKFQNKYYEVNLLSKECFKDVDFVLMSAGSQIDYKYGLIAEKSGAIVIDNSSAFRQDNEISLIVPEINYTDFFNSKRKIIANPNCVTIQSVICLNAIKKKYHLKKVIYNTYQSVSGSGMKGIFDYQSALDGYPKEFYPFDITKTCIPCIGKIDDANYTDEEKKMEFETQKILSLPNLEVHASCVRVPILFGHGVSIYLETEENINLIEIKKIFKEEKSIIYLESDIPTSIEIINTDKICVGRLRQTSLNSLMFFCYGDNIRKGAASNALQILKKLISQ